MWIITLVTEAQVREFTPAFRQEVERCNADPLVRRGLDSWAATRDLRDHITLPSHSSLRAHHWPSLDDHGEAVETLFYAAQLRQCSFVGLVTDNTDDHPDIVGGRLTHDVDGNDGIGAAPLWRGGPHWDVFITRRLCPLFVLLGGLGWERAQRVPGTAGLYLLDPATVTATLADVEAAFDLSGTERLEVLDLMQSLSQLGDCPELDVSELLDCVPRLHRAAAECGAGILSSTESTFP